MGCWSWGAFNHAVLKPNLSLTYFHLIFTFSPLPSQLSSHTAPCVFNAHTDMKRCVSPLDRLAVCVCDDVDENDETTFSLEWKFVIRMTEKLDYIGMVISRAPLNTPHITHLPPTRCKLYYMVTG